MPYACEVSTGCKVSTLLPRAASQRTANQACQAAWPGGCDRPAAAPDVHHIRHKSDGGETSVQNCGLFCEFHHETCIHRCGWEVVLHPDGTMEARSPDGTQILRSHAPPDRRAA